jgi:hypothetical protein
MEGSGGNPGMHVYQKGAVADVYQGGRTDELTVGVWPGDRAALRDRASVDWKRFQWLGGLQDDNSGSRFFFALPPETPQARVHIVRQAFERTVRNAGLLAEAKMHQIDLGNMRPLSHQEVEEAL